MSHQTGITANDELRQIFANAKHGDDVRLLKVTIINEELTLDKSCPPSRKWDDDYDKLVLPCIKQKEACYILYRFDAQNDQGHLWLLISFTSDHAPVRTKMLYAATRATLKQEFGGGLISDEISGTVPEDVNLEGYHKHLKAKAAPAPLTMAEEELEMVKRTEVRTVGVDTKHQTVRGMAFPFDNDALAALESLRDGSCNYVQLSLELNQEEVHLAQSSNIKVDQLRSHIPADHGRYHVFRYSHTHEGDFIHPIVFIYSMPGGKCPIKERMLYSSCKAAVIEVVEQTLGAEIERKVEVDEPKEVTETFIYDEVHPKRDIVRQKFSKPKGPAGRGPMRVTKPSDS